MTDPPVSPDVDLRDFPYMPLDVVRLRDSGLSSRASAEGFRCAVLLWCAAWHQIPASSLPNNDAELGFLAGFGRDQKAWKKYKEEALHGFVLCSDGRFYHPVVAEKANEAWAKHRSASRRAKAGASARWGDKQCVPYATSIPTSSPESTAKAMLKDAKREGEGEGRENPSSLPEEGARAQAQMPEKPVRKNGSFEAKCRALVGEEPVLTDPNFNPLADAVGKDGITEDDVIVGISSAMAKADFRPRHWGQFVGWARHAAQDRLAGKPKITKSGNGSDPNETMVDIGTGPMPEANLMRMIREPNGVGVENWIETYAGNRARFREKVEQRAPHLVKFFPVEKHVA